MTTSSAYTPAPPDWLVQHARTHSPRRFFDRTWRASDPALLARITGGTDTGPGEGSVHGMGQAFPHSLATSTAPQQAILHTPFGDDLVLDAALAAIDQLALGADATPDLLAIGFSSHDYAGHLWGPTSWEAVELMLELDRKLGRLFAELDRRFGRTGWAAVLTSDHGATPIVERSFTIGSRRIRTAEIVAAVDAAFVAHAGPPTVTTSWVAKVVSSSVYLTPDGAALPPAILGAALDDAATRLARLDNIAIAGRVDAIRGDCDRRTGLERAVCLSQVPGESGELYVMPVAGSLITDYKSGTHHDAPFDDNRRVPILVRGPGIRPQLGTGTLLQVAPTVAALLGIPAPPAATAPALFGLDRRR